MNKQDKRVLKTKYIIKMTVAELLKIKPLEQISVTEVATVALIQRATFYNHYGNVYDVLDDIQLDMTEIFHKNAHPSPDMNFAQAVEHFLMGIYKSVKGMENCFKTLLLTKNPLIWDKIKDSLVDGAIDFVQMRKANLERTDKYAVCVFMNGIIDTFFVWYKDFKGQDISEYVKFAIETATNLAKIANLE